MAFLPAGHPRDVAVVIDVLRMTTTAAALAERGMRRLTIVAGTDDALELSAASGVRLFGERNGLPFPGFDGGNSPVEHLGADYSELSAILCTTNGSKAVEAVQNARHLLLGAIVNARAVARVALELATESVTLVCAGTDGTVSLDDVLGAGCIASEIVTSRPDVRLSDAAKIALMLASAPAGIEATLATAHHADVLRDLGFGDDVEFAARASSVNLVARRTSRGPSAFEVVEPTAG